MRDRDSLLELYGILSNATEQQHLVMTADALPYIKSCLGLGSGIYFRRRFSVCRMLIDLHLPVESQFLDILLATVLSHSLPGDNVPANYKEVLGGITSDEPKVAEIMATLRHTDYADKSYYKRLVRNKYALLIRLAERATLVESLYEWAPEDARRYIAETREYFFPMCIYMKEHYREFLGAATILMEKMRNLCIANEALLDKYEAIEGVLFSEILFLREENTAIRAMMEELKNSTGV